MNTMPLDESQTASVRDEWIRALRALQNNLTEWSLEEGWQVRPLEKVFREDSTGQYAAPDLVIETPAGERLNVEIKGRGPTAAAGRVQVSAWPTLFRVTLLHRPGEANWVIRTDSGIPLRQPWNHDTFVSVAKDLLSADQ